MQVTEHSNNAIIVLVLIYATFGGANCHLCYQIDFGHAFNGHACELVLPVVWNVQLLIPASSDLILMSRSKQMVREAQLILGAGITSCFLSEGKSMNLGR